MNNTATTWNLEGRSQMEVVTLGLYLALTAPDDEKAQHAAAVTEEIARGLSKEEIEQAKADALLLLEIDPDEVMSAVTEQESEA